MRQSARSIKALRRRIKAGDDHPQLEAAVNLALQFDHTQANPDMLNCLRIRRQKRRQQRLRPL
jgi:hypothetical protein